MGALSQTYVDPSIAGNSGAGTIGDPYGDLQYALNTMTRDATNGDRINIKSGTAEILAATLSFATYGTPTAGAQLVFQGYTSAAGDGGQGAINGNNGNFSIFAAAKNHTHFKDLELFNTGTAVVVDLNLYSTVIECEVHNSSGDGVECSGVGSQVIGCNIHDIGALGIDMLNASNIAYGNYLTNGTKTFSSAISSVDGSAILRNIISIGGASNGIRYGYYPKVIGNSVLSSAGTGVGINPSGNDRTHYGGVVANNLVEGFSGAGGKGIETGTGAGDAVAVFNNAAYNNTTNFSNSDQVIFAEDGNEVLGASPFAKSGSDTFADRFTYFAPVDTGNVFGGAYQ